jgi:glycosyltransferase involved in cell wall biosynthesis
MQRHSRILVNAGYEVCFVGRNKKHSLPLQNEIFEQKRLNCYFEKGKLFYVEYNLKLFFYLLFAPCDILLAVDYDTLLPNTLIAKRRSKKLVFDAHEYFTEVPELSGRKAIQYIWNVLGNWAIPKVDLAYTVGPKLAEIFTQQHHKTFHSILNVPPLNNIASFGSNQSEKPIILYQGALNVGRGIEALIKAMKEINGVLWLAGEGDLSATLRNLAKEESLEEKVKFLGFVQPKDLPALTHQAYVCCNLLLPQGKSYYYSLANKFFDYMHAAKPQICANFPEYTHINKHHEVAVLCQANESEIALALNKLLSDKALYEKLSNNCLKAAQVYNLQHEKQKLLNLYATL